MNPKLIFAVRFLLGLMVLVFGLNKFFHFIPLPELGGEGAVLMDIWQASGFMFLVGVIEVVAGLALLVGRYVPLALIFLTAVLFNAFLFHAMHDLAGIGGSAVGLVLCFVLTYVYRDRFSSIFSA